MLPGGIRGYQIAVMNRIKCTSHQPKRFFRSFEILTPFITPNTQFNIADPTVSPTLTRINQSFFQTHLFKYLCKPKRRRHFPEPSILISLSGQLFYLPDTEFP
jgi:hypothetical protein